MSVCVREIEGGGGKKETKREGARQTQTECRTEIVMGLITKKWDKRSTESLHAQFRKSILLVQRKALCMEANLGQYP